MKVLLVSHNFLPEHRAGTEIYTWQLAKGLQNLGHEVEVVFLDCSDEQLVRRFSETRRPHALAPKLTPHENRLSRNRFSRTASARFTFVAATMRTLTGIV